MIYDTQPGPWQRLGRSILWILKTALVSLILIVLLSGLAWLGFLGFTELRRSFDNVFVRMEVNQRATDLLRSDVNNLMSENPPQQRQINSLETQANELEARLAALQEELTADLAQQQQLLTALEENLATVTSRGEAEAAAVETALVALQADINANGSRIDSLGGEVDALSSDVTRLNAGVDEARQAAVAAGENSASMSDMQQTLTLFRVWQLISRARLYLFEANVGLATADTELALRTIDSLVLATAGATAGATADATATPTPEDGPEDIAQESAALQVVQTRLALALASLSADPELAARDLESAWDELDRVLADRVAPALVTAEGEEAPATPEATATPADD
jgi:predicted  nucleic acid-binding Zn-ribbon protein